jgi:glyoxylase-like metal-dependent hydrolase (beta-lactamase superfamily II)
LTPDAAKSSAAPKGAASNVDHVQLYALDCGRIEISDFGFFTDAGRPVGKGKTLADPCFLIRHPKGTLLWDTGLNESIAKSKDGVDFHGDHVGNANMFTSSTWLVNRAEVEAASKSPPPVGVEPSTFSEIKNVKTKLLDGDEDVFGDGSVRILQTPGHTAGHQSLLVQLPKAGAIILSGDLAHSRVNWEKHVVPSFNDSHDNTIASMKRVDGIVKTSHARFIVQHSKEDFESLPKFPAYLD